MKETQVGRAVPSAPRSATAADFELVLVNAAHLRHVPGRKSDVADAVWLADLLAHGFVPGSFVPPPAVPALRDLDLELAAA